ncbi:hypothetical protein [Haloechinothrix salitolerans]|uniref:Uncharacterized protein n=1 Tax=Haloechinothrix salitolerans TaxID=926830 RepID=A0ABW2C0A2_9PSEU
MAMASATLTIWATAWLNGKAAADDVLDALTTLADRHDVVAADETTAAETELPVAGKYPAPLARLLAALRTRGADAGSLALPAPGDPRGLGGSGALVGAALNAGEASVFAAAGLALVPDSPADDVVRWTVYPHSGDAGEHVGISEAEQALTEAIRASAATLADLDVARERPDAHDALRVRLRRAPSPRWPDGMPGRALRVLQRADEIAAILELAAADEPGGAVSASAARHRANALRPLDTAVRQARRAAVGEAVRLLAQPVTRP